MLQMNLYNIFLIFHIVVMTVFSKNIDIKAGLEKPIPNSVGLKFVAEIVNLKDEDCAVDIYPDECCLYDDDERCDIVEIMGSAGDVISGGATKTFTMVAPLLDAYQRRGHCTLFVDSKPKSKIKTIIRDTVKIKFDTKLKKSNLPNIAPFPKNIDRDPLNDGNPVDCDTHYNGKRSYFNTRKQRCVRVPVCLSMRKGAKKTIYNPVSNKCDNGSTVNAADLNNLKELTNNSVKRVAKEVMVLQVNHDETTTLSNLNDEIITSDQIFNTLKVEKAPTTEKPDKKLQIKEKTKVKTKEKIEAKICKMKAAANKTQAILKYLKYNKNTVKVLGGVSLMQCCFIFTMIFCVARKNCICCTKSKDGYECFDGRHDASITTPLITTSNINTETNECYYMTDSNTDIDKKIRCYKACQKKGINKMKLCMSDDITSKYTAKQKKLRISESEIVPYTKKVEYKIKKLNRNDYQSITEDNDNVPDDFQDTKCNVREIIVKGNDNTKLSGELFTESSEVEVYCSNYNNESNMLVNTSYVENNCLVQASSTEACHLNKSDSAEKSAQASFSNDSIDDFLSEKGILCMDDIASKCSYASLSSDVKSTQTNQSSKTSKNNVVKSIMNLLPKKVKGPASDPGITKTLSPLDVELLYVSTVSFASSLDDTDPANDIKTVKGSTG